MYRPKPNESDEDILAMQDKFLSEKRKNSDFQPSIIQSNIIHSKKFKTNKNNEINIEENLFQDSNINFNEDKQQDPIYYPKTLPFILGTVTEKNTNVMCVSTSLIKDEDLSIKNNNNQEYKPKSIFGQRLKNKSSDISKADKKHDNLIKNQIPNCSFLLQGQDANEIHSANTRILESMTEIEILKEKKSLMSIMNSETVNFIKSLRKNRIPDFIKQNKNIFTHISEENDDFINGLDNDIIVHPNLSHWINFDILEKDKMEWMKCVKENNLKKDEKYEARFDFKGYLLPYQLEYNEKNKILFHHEKDPDRPGYTLEELFYLARSTITQQRSIALIALAGLLEYNNLGFYNNIIDIPFTKIFFVLRFALDENIISILEPALKGLKNLIYNKFDEISLDNNLVGSNGLFQPRLLTTNNNIKENNFDSSEIKDFHLTEIDIINGYIRTDVLLRLKYILSVIKPQFNCIQNSIYIITRLARHSLENANKIFEIEGLIQLIINQFLPSFIVDKGHSKSNSEYYKIICDTLRLIRVLISQSKELAEKITFNFNLLDILLNYIGNTVIDSTYLMKIHIESFYLYSVLITYNIGNETFHNLLPIFWKILNDYTISIDLTSSRNILYEHVIAVFTLLTHYFACSNIKKIDTSYLSNFFGENLQKWYFQLNSLEKHSTLQFNLFASIFYCITAHNKHGSNVININHFLNDMLNSQKNNFITSNIIISSNLLSTSGFQTEQINIPNLDIISFDWNKKIIPIICNGSPFIFLSSIVKYLLLIENDELSLKFLLNTNILEYISELVQNKLKCINNWFTRIEFYALSDIIQLYTKVKIDEQLKDKLYRLAFKLTYIFPFNFEKELDFLLKNIIFDKNWFADYRLICNLNLNNDIQILSEIKDILSSYLFIFNFRIDIKKETLAISNWNQPILSKNWIYMPILTAYGNSQDTTHKLYKNIPQTSFSEQHNKEIICNCLKFILILEDYFNDIIKEISLTDRFCHLLCVYLCDNSLFLDNKIKVLLKKNTKIIFNLENKHNELDFDSSLSVVNNFQDLYIQLIDHYQAVSYGDDNFSACILVPLSQKHNIKWRKIIWSEYAGCLKFLNCPENLLCYPLTEYLFPNEKDLSLLKCYDRALNSNLLKVESITYKIAFHHLEMIKNKMIIEK